MRVVVTGGSGKAGQWVVRLLAAAGHAVTNLDVVQKPELDLPGDFCRINLDDAGEVYDALCQVRPQGICHLAANPWSRGHAQIAVFDGNVRSTYNVLQCAGDLGVSRVIYATSIMATGLVGEGHTPKQIPFDESERYPTVNAYALSKYVAEVTAESLAARYAQTAFIGMRINDVVAPTDYAALFPPAWTDPSRDVSVFWSYIDARDVATAFLSALEGASTGHEIFLIAAADTRAKRPLRELMATYFDGYDRFEPDHDDFTSAVNCGKMLRFFGWKPTYSWREMRLPEG
jgi:nucleoside-diphosphate-sugar epimerase